MTRQMTFLVFTLLSISLFAVEPAFCQAVEVRASGGVSNPARTHQRGNENAFLGVAGVRYHFRESHITAGVDFLFNYFDFEIDPDANYKILGYLAAIEYYLGEGELHPYAGVSAGLFNQRQNRALPGTGSDAESFTRFGFIPRFGLSYELSDRMSGFFEIGGRVILTPRRNDAYYDAALGLSYKF